MKSIIQKITILGGTTKDGEQEPTRKLEINSGDIFALVGPTGSGKSQLLSDIEQLAACDTQSSRTILLNDGQQNGWNSRIMAQLSQSMNFVIDMLVGDFIILHSSSRGLDDDSIVGKVINLTNELAGEPVNPDANMMALSGGQSRALMIADIALISDAPVVLIDEIENAGINRLQALKILSAEGKIVIAASHDPLIILLAPKRIVMNNGGMSQVIETSATEKKLLNKLIAIDNELSDLREELRLGNHVEL